MEPHLHLNVFMGGMLLSAGLGLEGRTGSRAETTNAVVRVRAPAEVVKPNWERLFTNGGADLLQPEVSTVCLRERQIYPMTVETNGLLK